MAAFDASRCHQLDKGQRMLQKGLRRSIPWLTTITALLAITLLTPFIMKQWAPSGMKWGELSDISQTYAAVSIPMSAAALIGVTWSLVLQARQMRAENEERWLSTLREMLMASVNDPSLLPCWEPPAEPTTQEAYRRAVFINVIFNGWRGEYMNGLIGDDILRAVASRTMGGEVARGHWGATRHIWHEEAKTMGKKYARFVTVMDEAWEVAKAQGPALSPNDYFLPAQSGIPETRTHR
ncbi:DUF6082 family protein [Streptomyces sp. NPDC059639]|uniref:DUF6082 family protein n=1 Tax=Streptomyces sp. NPDC059639 TaxID=3346891 RepID=UPI0036942346